jgi:UDP-N-acetylglucosamine 4,6-dehydratase
MTYSNWLITGGCGSLGTALVEALLKTRAKKIVIFDNSEYEMSLAIKKYKDKRIRFFLGDIREYDRLKRAFNKVDAVIHTAALKHVDIGETNPGEMVKTNIIGTENVIKAAIDCKVKKLLCISTDKACNPTNLYGATKLCAEKYAIDGNVYGKTKISAMRCGNFIGSKGSVIEYFDNLVLAGAKWLPLTDVNMRRFWIKISDAAEFALNVVKDMSGGEVYCPKLKAKSVKDIIALDYGLPYKVIGLRPGEKLNEGYSFCLMPNI